jgi:hypothetical protein
MSDAEVIQVFASFALGILVALVAIVYLSDGGNNDGNRNL